MAVTLAQASLNADNDIDHQIIDEFRKSSFLLDNIPFDQSVNPSGGGSTLVYGYTRQITQRSAAFRTINTEYVPAEVTKQQYTVNLRPMGGSFQIDRVLTGIGAVSETSFQLSQLIKATRAYFADQVVNGDTAVTTNGFDGLSKALTGSSTEVLSTLDFTVIDTQPEALQAIQKINDWLSLLDGRPDALLMNGTTRSLFSMIAAFSGQLRSATDSFGEMVETFRGIPLIDLGDKAGASTPVIPITTGKSDIYAVRFGIDGFHAVSVPGSLIQTWLPDFTVAGAVKTGECELGPAAIVLKASKAAGVLRGVKVA